MLRILYLSRPTLFSTPGGDTVQMMKTAEFLERNFDVKISVQPDPEKIDYSEFDLIHFFNLIRPNNILPHTGSGIPFVVSSVFVDYGEYDRSVRKGIGAAIARLAGKYRTEYLKILARWLKNKENPGSFAFFLTGYKKSIQKILDGCAVLLPNSESELNRLKQEFHYTGKHIIVPNAADTSLFTDKPGIRKEGIICAGRIEGIKNQLNLIRAVNRTDFGLKIIGKPSPNHLEYYRKCREEAGPGVEFIDHADPEELAEYYRKARVHAMVSWFETTGLSSLEAAASGCNVVISAKGDQQEYFGDDAFYAEPDDIDSIVKALQLAYKAPKPEKLIRRIREKYNWQKTAEKTFEAYQLALSGG